MALRCSQPLTVRYLPGGKEQPAHKTDNQLSSFMRFLENILASTSHSPVVSRASFKVSFTLHVSLMQLCFVNFRLPSLSTDSPQINVALQQVDIELSADATSGASSTKCHFLWKHHFIPHHKNHCTMINLSIIKQRCALCPALM
jgi:hypothetical protein